MGNEQILARGKRNLRHRLNRVIQLATRTLVDNGNENGGRKKSFEGFPSLVIAAGVNKGRLDGLTLKAKPNFVSTDTAPDFLVDSGRGPTRLVCCSEEPTSVAAVNAFRPLARAGRRANTWRRSQVAQIGGLA